MPFMSFQPDTIKDRFRLVSEAQHMSSSLLMLAFANQEEQEGVLEKEISFSKEEVILLGTLLHQLSAQVKNESLD